MTPEQLLTQLNQQKIRVQVAEDNYKNKVNNDTFAACETAQNNFEETVQQLAALGYIIGQNIVYDYDDNVYRFAIQTSFL